MKTDCVAALIRTCYVKVCCVQAYCFLLPKDPPHSTLGRQRVVLRVQERQQTPMLPGIVAKRAVYSAIPSTWAPHPQ